LLTTRVGQRFAVDVLGDDQQRTAGAATSSSTGSRSFIELIRFSWIRMTGFSRTTSIAFRIGDEVRRQIPAVELHPLDEVQ
jgi:hypothetical protein